MLLFHRQVVAVKKDLRQTPRVEFHAPVTVMGINEAAQVLDFSLSGFFVRVGSTVGIEEGQLVRLALRFPGENNITFIKAKVMRTEENGFGCRFTDLDPQLSEVLERNFDFLRMTFPIQ